MGLEELLDAHKIKSWEVLDSSAEELARKLNRPTFEIEKYIIELKSSIPLPTQRSVQPPSYVSTGIPHLDAFLGNGIAKPSILEIYGPSGSGKTCLCCQIALSSRTSCVYIASEDTAQTISRKLQHLARVNNIPAMALSNVRVVQIRTPSELRVALNKLRFSNAVPDLVLIDSIAAIYDFGSNSETLIESRYLDLRKLVHELNAAVLVVNQIRAAVNYIDAETPESTDYMSYNMQKQILERSVPLASQKKNKYRPAMGIEWAQTLDARVGLGFTRTGRYASLQFSKWNSPNTIRMQMTDNGLICDSETVDMLSSQISQSTETMDVNTQGTPGTPGTPISTSSPSSPSSPSSNTPSAPCTPKEFSFGHYQ